MARYRTKDETDLVWNRIRRQLTRDLDTKIQNFREELLNEILSDAWEKYTASLKDGTLIQLEDHASSWVDDVLTRLKPALLETADGDVEAG